MELLGTIEPTPGTSSGRNEWISLIGTHPALAPVPPRQGINPFTRGQVEFNPPPDSAQVMVKGSEVGRITWAEDESQLLVAWARAGSEPQVANVAADVAARLGWKYLPSSAT